LFAFNKPVNPGKTHFQKGDHAMKRNKFVIAIVLIALLSAFFGAGGTKPALAEAAFLDDVAGIAAYAQVTPGENFLVNAQSACDGALEVDTETYFICSVLIDGYASVYAAHVFVHSDGWIMAYYLADEPAAKMLDVIAQPLDALLTYPTLLDQAVNAVGVAAGIDILTNPIAISYFDFSNPEATAMLFVAEDKAEDGPEFGGDDNYWFTLTMPVGTFYEISYAFYQNYYPVFSLEGVNFVLTNADYIGPATLGTIYGELATTSLLPGQSYLFEVDTISYAAAGYGALLVTYSNAELVDFYIDSADWVEKFTLTAPSTDLTDLFTFDFAPADFAKLEPADLAAEQPTTVTLSWEASLDATSYEYCIDESDDFVCDTGWISTGVATSVTLSGLPYNATYYWQARAVNSYATTEADAGEWWSFATITGAPAAFSKLSPADGMYDVATSPLLDWEDADGAEYYEYCIATIFENCTNWINTGLVSQAVVTLEEATFYSWQVRAGNSADTTDGNDGEKWSFNTIDTGFLKVSPTDSTTDVSPKAVLMWDPMTGATGYEYCVDTTDNNACNRWVSAGENLTVTLKGLKYATTYYWQVRAVTETGTIEANAGDWWTFTTRDRKAPTKTVPPFGKVSPIDGAIDQPVVNLVLDWDDVAKATSYAYCIDMTNDGSCVNWIETDVNQVTIPELAYDTTYYWQVRATVAGIVGYADAGEYWSFTTIAEPVEP
jgi:hypothetical protein